MAGGPLRSVVQYLRRFTGAADAAALSDGELLERFVEQHEEAAFEALLNRHGPLVLGVCRRVLHDAHEADDAFQATFLVLVRKAGSIGKRDSVGSWLYGVAYRTALKARTEAARRREHERKAVDMATAGPIGDMAWHELRPVLDEELNRLPEKYRAPVVLCYLEGRTNEEAARELGWTKGTVSGRLARARDLLRQRLTRRGLALSAGLFVTALAQQVALAAVPAPLAGSTLQAASLVAAGEWAAAGALSAPVAALTEGVLQAMLLTKLKTAAAVVLALCVVGTGAGVATRQVVTGRQADVEEERAALSDPAPAPELKEDKDLLQGTWTLVSGEQEGKAVHAELIGFLHLVFAGEKLTLRIVDEDREGTYQLDPSKKPNEIDLIFGGDTGKGIYLLEGDALKVCWTEGGQERPSEFTAKQGSRRMLLVLKREAPARAEEPRDPEKKKRVQEVKNRLATTGNLKQIGLALHNYHDTYGRLPPAALYSKDGKPLLSWRVLVLPFLEQDNLYRQFKLEEPWDSPHNKKLLMHMPNVYAPVGVSTPEPHTTFYQVFVGQGTLFEGIQGTRFDRVTDGMSTTILAVEAGEPVPWSKPQDLTYEENKPLPKLGGQFPTFSYLVLADGSVRHIAKKFDEAMFRRMITCADGQVVDPSKLDR
jgi:RNA polymerase sigma factor (sigma-70 family)